MPAAALATHTGRWRGPALAAVLAIYAAAALGSGLDRMAELSPRLAAVVPAPFAVRALRASGRARLERHTPAAAAEALVLAESAVQRAPIDPESTALLGAARLASGDPAGADTAFRVAGKMGWHIPLTQSYWMNRALDLGAYPVAALRLDSLLREQPTLVTNAALIDPIEARAEGRAALAARLRLAPDWLEGYAGSVTQLDTPHALRRAAVFAAASSAGTTIGCPQISPLVGRLIALGQVPVAAALWQAQCPAAARTLVYDGDFAHAILDQDRTDFSWTFLGQSDTAISLVAAEGGGQAVHIASTAPAPRLLLRQLLFVSPGRYRLSWRARDDDGHPSGQLLAALGCSPTEPTWLPAQPAAGEQRFSATVAVDGSCQAHWLLFGVGAGTVAAALSAVSLERI